MDIGISIFTDKGSDRNWEAIEYVSNLLEKSLASMDYGTINHYLLFCNAMKTEPGFEKWSTPRRPRFSEHRRFRNLDDTFTDCYGVYTCDISIDFEEYDEFCAATEEEARRIVARKVIESFSNLDRLSKKAKAFDKERFKADVINLFKENGLID